MLLDLVNRISSERKVKKKLDIQVWVLSRSSRGRPENVLGTSRINLPGTSLEHQIKTSPGRRFRTSPGRQIGTSPWRSNRIFRGHSGDVGEGHPRDVLGTNICQVNPSVHYPSKISTMCCIAFPTVMNSLLFVTISIKIIQQAETPNLKLLKNTLTRYLNCQELSMNK